MTYDGETNVRNAFGEISMQVTPQLGASDINIYIYISTRLAAWPNMT